MITASPHLQRRWRLLAFAGGDFGFNLYWQSVMLYLLFYYTEGVGLPLRQASACYAIAMAWDGLISLGVGVWADRRLGAARFRGMVAWGSIPLGLAFALAYLPPPASGAAAFGWVLAGHMLFRTTYALVNIPYLALSASLADNDAERALIAGWRMLAGAGAAVLVAVLTLPLGTALSGGGGAAAYSHAAWIFAALASLFLIGAMRWAPGVAPRAVSPIPPARGAVLAVWRNRAFANLATAMLAMTAAATMVDKTVLYYFKYHLHAQQAGELTLGWMMGVGALAVPIWMAIGRRIGVGGCWLLASGLCGAALAVFIAGGIDGPQPLRLFLVVVQAALAGLQFALWALLPAVVEGFESETGCQSGAVIYGWAALMQRAGIGLGTLLVGGVLKQLALGNAVASGGALRIAIAALPLALLLLSVAIVVSNPLMRWRSTVD